MGCISSKIAKKEIRLEAKSAEACPAHVVSLTSSTYGALILEKTPTATPIRSHKEEEISRKEHVRSPKHEPEEEETSEVINVRELMEDLGDPNASPGIVQKKKTPKTKTMKTFMEARSPLKFLNQIGTPRKARTYGGKENKPRRGPDSSPIKPLIHSKASVKLSFTPASKVVRKTETPAEENSKRKSFSPLFDPELLALYEKELSEEERIKKLIRLTPRSRKLKDPHETELLLNSYELKSPPGGEISIVLYTTTLRGIRKTYEDCNAVRAIIQSHCVQFVERDISMDSGFKEELRVLMGDKGMIVPAVFVKGRFIGSVEELLKLEEEDKLEWLFNGMPQMANGSCKGCGNVRFVLCSGCNGSTKVLDEKGRRVARCEDCNENGLIKCPICC